MTTVRPATTPIKSRNGRQPKDSNPTFDSNLHDFLRDTELTARKIIKDSDRKRHDAINKTKRMDKLNAKSRKALELLDRNTLINPAESNTMMKTTFVPNNTSNLSSSNMTSTLPLPENVIRTNPNPNPNPNRSQHRSNLPKSTVLLQEVPERNTHNNNNDVTSVSGFNASFTRSASAATLRRTNAGVRTENRTATSMLQSSTAFSHDTNYSDVAEGINDLKGPNAITRGLGSLRPAGIKTNVSQMSISYHDSETGGMPGGKSSILDMGHFASKTSVGGVGASLQNNRQLNSRNAITTASRANFGNTNGGDRPHTVAGMSPARGAPRSAATKIAMQNMNTMLRTDVMQRTNRKVAKPKLHSKLNKHIFNKNVTSGFVNPAGAKKNYTFKPDNQAWQNIEPPINNKINPELEFVGPVSWCSDDIRVKWRGEREREEAWKVGRAAKIATKEMENGENGWIVPKVETERHPMHQLFWKYLKHENEQASKRAFMRAMNRRFNLDVHTIWLTNLPHLSEHGELKSNGVHTEVEGHTGLQGARDVANILKARSQIQSVSYKKSIEAGVKDEPNEDWDAEFASPPKPSPAMNERPLPPPTLEPLMENELVSINNESMLLSIHRYSEMERVTFETAAVLNNGRWEIPKSGGAEKLEPGLTVNFGEDIIKLSPKKLKQKRLQELRDEAKNGRGYVDEVKNVMWRLNLFNILDGSVVQAALPEEEMLRVADKKSAKLQRSYTGNKNNKGGTIVHRQGIRVMCGTVLYNTMASVMLSEGGEDGSVNIDLNVNVKVEKGKSFNFNCRNFVQLTKRLTTYEARERLKIGGCAPARDMSWWADKKRGDTVWRKLLASLVLLPGAVIEEKVKEEVKIVTSKKEKKKAEKERKLQKEQAAVFGNKPERLDFVGGEGGEILGLISSAYDILSLVKIRGPDDEEEIVVEGVHEIKHKRGVEYSGGEAWGANRRRDWEAAADYNESLSVRLSGVDGYLNLVPGVAEVGKLEPVRCAPRFVPEEEEKSRRKVTSASLMLRRDADTSSSNSIQCLMSLALDTPHYAPPAIYWESSDAPLGLAKHEVIENVIPKFVAVPSAVREDGLKSDLDARRGDVLYILSGSEVESDFGGMEEPIANLKYDSIEKVVGHNDLGFEIVELEKKLKPEHCHRRRMTKFNSHGFRQNLLTSKEILRPIARIAPSIFGITKRGSSANTPSVNGRTIWHSDQRCVEQLCRQRTPLDMLSVIAAKSGAGFCDAKSYSLLMSGYDLDEMVGIGLKTYDKAYGRIAAKKKLKEQQGALQDKIDMAEENLKKRQGEMKRVERDSSQKKARMVDKFGDTGGKMPESMSQESWGRRLRESVLVERRGEWEHRRIVSEETEKVKEEEKEQMGNKKNEFTPVGMDFYHKGVAGGEVLCSWDPPLEFDNFALSEIVPGDLVGDGTVDLAQDSSEQKITEEADKVAVLAKMIAEDENLLRVLAERLGILVKRDTGDEGDLVRRVGEGRDPDMKRFFGVNGTELADSDNDWSDSDDEVGNTENGESNSANALLDATNSRVKSELGQTVGDMKDFEKKKNREKREAETIGQKTVKPRNVPSLDLGVGGEVLEDAQDAQEDDDDMLKIEKHIKGKGWRRLHKAKFAPNIFEQITKTRSIKGAQETIINTLSVLRPPLIVDPTKVIKVVTDEAQFAISAESLFVKDVMDDQVRIVDATRKRKEREEALLAGGGMNKIVENQPSAFTIADQLAVQGDKAEGNDEDPENLAARAIECARTGNLPELEIVLEKNVINVETRDGFGNSLLHLAVQQGNKRMAKFLLRRGSNIKTQNNVGNSVLHHCHIYKHMDLAEYLMSKGADDSLLNAQGCTCYEGLSQDDVADI